MWKKTFAWLDARTGYRRFLTPWTTRVLPEGPRWGYSTASCLFWMLAIELVTGLLLMTSYSPSTSSAWASVFYIEQLPAGSFIRGLHYWGGQALIILFAVHTIRVLLTAAYRPPRELIWVTGLFLIPLLMVWAVTGNPLSAAQKGFAQIKVEGDIIRSTPLVGPVIRQILIGGDEVGNLTLTHLNALHVAFLPLAVGCLMALHIYQVYRHSVMIADPAKPQGTPYWPYQSIRNLIVFSAVFAVVVALALRYRAPLEVPADPGLDGVPRPEWYFLFLFELRRYFTGRWEFVATVVIPAVTMLFLLLLPLMDWVCSKWLGAVLRYTVVVGGVAVWLGLTLTSTMRDQHDAEFQASKKQMAKLASRARTLASLGIPPEGAAALLKHDPKTQGPKLFGKFCAGCHSHADQRGHGIVAQNPSAANLSGFATRRWVADILTPEKFSSDRYFGKTTLKDGDMTGGVTDYLDPQGVQKVIAALSAEAKLKSQQAIDKADAQRISAGVALIKDDSDGCTSCHKFHDVGELGSAPDLTDYGSRSWLIGMINDPTHEQFYGELNDRMPAFSKQITQDEIGLLADWLRSDWYEPGNAADDTAKAASE